MAGTIEIEVMYNDTDPDTGTLRRKRVGLDAAHTLDRDDIWYILLSDDASSIVPVANAHRIINGVTVDRITFVQWDDTDSSVAFLLRRGGEVCLALWEDSWWNWVDEANPFTTQSPSSGIDPSFPKDALVFHMVQTPVSVAHSDYATAAFNSDMY